MRLSHISWNLAGLALPLLIAAIVVPHLIDKLGSERFGLLSLAWGLIGYAGVFDLGIGRAITQMVASLRGKNNLSSIPAVLVTAVRITLVTGLSGGLLIVLLALFGGSAWVETQSVSKCEVQIAMLLIAIALPAQAISATYRGVNEAYLKFKGISFVRVGLGMINFGVPYLVTFVTVSLPWLVATLVINRLLALFIFRLLAKACIVDNNTVHMHVAYSSSIAKALFHFGGWVTVSSIISPLLVQADRFVIAATISAAAVTIYVVPYEVVVQSLILVGSVSTVIFPSLSKLMYENPEQLKAFFLRWLGIVAGTMLLACGLLAMLLPTILKVWLKGNFSDLSGVIGQVLCIGVFINAIGSMYYALLHAKGRSDVTAILHLIEFPLFIFTLIFLLKEFGLVGAAWAWVGRMVFDTVALILCSRN
jgi:O-antigen/teichoic acid export membrane protein